MVRLFNLDLHISVIADVKAIVSDLYGSSIEIVNWSISGHNWVFNNPTPQVDIINQQTWRSITPAMISDFQTRYDDFLSSFDGFIVTHTPVFCMLYEKYKKPILLVNSCRYEQPYSWTGNVTLWNWLNSGLRRLQSSGQLVVVSNNKADQEYLRRGTGIGSLLLPSLCFYTGFSYKPLRKESVVYGARSFFPDCDVLVAKPEHYSWSELYSYKAIVHIPYEMSTMSLFEQYTAGVPLFLPSRSFYLSCIRNGSMPFGSIYGRTVIDDFSDEFKEALRNPEFWLDRADFYDSNNFKYVYYYDSAEDLIAKITMFVDTEYEARLAWIATRKRAIYDSWRALLFKHFLGAIPIDRLLQTK
jgi:hypothetical protein